MYRHSQEVKTITNQNTQDWTDTIDWTHTLGWIPQELIYAIQYALASIPVGEAIDTDTTHDPSYKPIKPFEEYCEDIPINNYLQVNCPNMGGFLTKWSSMGETLYVYSKSEDRYNSRFSEAAIKNLESSISTIKTSDDMEGFSNALGLLKVEKCS